MHQQLRVHTSAFPAGRPYPVVPAHSHVVVHRRPPTVYDWADEATEVDPTPPHGLLRP